MRVTVYAPTMRECGIASYSRQLIAALPAELEIRIVATDLARRDSPAELATALSSGDVAHLHYEPSFYRDERGKSFLPELLRRITVPKVVTVHFPFPPQRECLDLSESARLNEQGWMDSLLESVDHFIVHSRQSRDQIARHVPASKITFLPHPVPRPLDLCAPLDSTRARLGLEGRQVLTIFGFIKPHKGYELMLLALRELPPHVKLLLAGGVQHGDDPAYVDHLMDLARSLGLSDRLVISGYLPDGDLPAIMAVSDLVVAPFQSMSISGSIATALAYRRPVLASALEPNIELREWSEALALFTPGNAVDLATQAQALLGNPGFRGHLSRNAGEYAERNRFERLGERLASQFEATVRESRAQSSVDRGQPPRALISRAATRQSAAPGLTSGLADALEAAGIQVVDSGALQAQPTLDDDPAAREPSVAVSSFDAVIVELTATELDRPLLLPARQGWRGPRWIAYWSSNQAWLPEAAVRKLESFDEIWVPSRFVQRAFPPDFPRPVACIPTVVEAPALRGDPAGIREAERDRLGIAGADLLFLYAFDGNDEQETWDALRAIDCFQQSFLPLGEGASLVIAERSGCPASLARERIRAKIEGWSCIRLDTGSCIDRLLHACDVYLSLHSAKAFGLTAARAMALGKPAVLTCWSGPLDYATPTNSMPVLFELSRPSVDRLVASPNLESAADCIRHLRGHPELIRALGEEARATMSSRFSLSAATATIRQRLRFPERGAPGLRRSCAGAARDHAPPSPSPDPGTESRSASPAPR